MKNIRHATQDDISRVRSLIFQLQDKIFSYYHNQQCDLDDMKKLLHELEFDFEDSRLAQKHSDIMIEAHNILQKGDI